MCGLVGIFSTTNNRNAIRNQIANMKKKITHRGPDGHGDYYDENVMLGLGHQRLAIIDPENGIQPMITNDGRYAIVFNGAIYNYLELRRELIERGHPIKSFSDTEVILYAYAEWKEKCVDELRGMFSFAIWDAKDKNLFFARDRLGIKPFYYFFNGKQFIFASEIKAILASDEIKAESDKHGLQDYLTFQFCLKNRTLFKNIQKLEPGYCGTVSFQHDLLKLNTMQYWDINFNYDQNLDESYYVDNLVSLLEDSVRIHLRSDVPLGAHLSGGLDSSTVVCLASHMLSGVSFKSFTGAFKEGKEFDETFYAKEAAKFAGCDYQEIYIPGEEFPEIFPKLIYSMDEPLAGPGLIPQYYVSKLAAEHVKVALGGQGGDELYVGYARYFVAYLERCLKNSIYQQSDSDKITLQDITNYLPVLQTYQPMLQNLWREGLFGEDDSRYFRLVNRSDGCRHLFKEDIFENYSSYNDYCDVFNTVKDDSLINKMSYFDLKASLPALLHVEDRTSMSVSLESRVPLLDHKLVEFIAKVPPSMKFAKGQTKYLFREAVKNIVPSTILNRKDKMGFPVPLNNWYHGHSKEFVRDILFSNQAKSRGIYNFDELEKHFNNEHKFSRVIWGVLCLETWFRTFIDG